MDIGGIASLRKSPPEVESSPPNPPKGYVSKFQTLVKNCIRRSVGHTALISYLLGLCYLIAVYIDDKFYQGSIVGPAGILVLVILLNLLVWSIGIGTWKIGNWLQHHLSAYYKRATPPHGENDRFLRNIVFGFEIKEYSRDYGDIRCVWFSTVRFAFLGLAASILVLALEVWTSIPVSETLGLADSGSSGGANGGISTLGAILSVLLGKVVGILFLTTYSIAQYEGDVLLIFSIFILPGIFFVPATANLLRLSHYYHTIIVRETDSSIAWVLLGIFLLITASSLPVVLYFAIQ